jgi:thiamine kinase-like enzyme
VADLGAIITRLIEQLGPAEGEPVPLDGGITNRNFRLRIGGRDCVIRLPGKDTELLGIDRGAERAASREAARLGIAPAVLAADPDYLVTEFLAGAPIEGERLRADPSTAAQALRAFHDSGLQLTTRFWVPELLDSYAQTVSQRGGRLPAEYADAQQLVMRIAAVLPLDDPVACHDDLLPGNLLARDAEPGRALLVDWEYAGMGHRMFDLGNLAVNNDFDERAEELVLEAYFGEPPSTGHRAALKLMRLVSDAREAAWGVVQGTISELDFDFAAYAEEHFARLRRNASAPEFEDWLDAATA